MQKTCINYTFCTFQILSSANLSICLWLNLVTIISHLFGWRYSISFHMDGFHFFFFFIRHKETFQKICHDLCICSSPPFGEIAPFVLKKCHSNDMILLDHISKSESLSHSFFIAFNSIFLSFSFLFFVHFSYSVLPSISKEESVEVQKYRSVSVTNRRCKFTLFFYKVLQIVIPAEDTKQKWSKRIH